VLGEPRYWEDEAGSREERGGGKGCREGKEGGRIGGREGRKEGGDADSPMGGPWS
jgi:hypothetical protein